MATPASIRNHPIHPMLIVFPIGLFIFSLVCDVVYHAGSANPFWKGMAFYSIGGGIIGALLAAIPGFIDYLSLPEGVVRKTATLHMVMNLVVVAIFIFNLGLRYNAAPRSEILGVVLSVIGIGLMAGSGWLGGALVYEHGVGVNVPRERDLERERDRQIPRRAA